MEVVGGTDRESGGNNDRGSAGTGSTGVKDNTGKSGIGGNLPLGGILSITGIRIREAGTNQGRSERNPTGTTPGRRVGGSIGILIGSSSSGKGKTNGESRPGITTGIVDSLRFPIVGSGIGEANLENVGSSGTTTESTGTDIHS
jgi:hypothetical protein